MLDVLMHNALNALASRSLVSYSSGQLTGGWEEKTNGESLSVLYGLPPSVTMNESTSLQGPYISSVTPSAVVMDALSKQISQRIKFFTGYIVGNESYDTLDRVHMSFKRGGLPDGTIKCEIQGDNAGVPNGVVLATSNSVFIGAVSTTAWAQLAFTFDSSVKLITLQHYHIVFKWDQITLVDAGNYIMASINSVDSGIPDYQALTSTTGGASWTIVNFDFPTHLYCRNDDPLIIVKRIKPLSLVKWRDITFSKDFLGAGRTLVVDILDWDDGVIIADVVSGQDLSTILAEYSSIKVRITMTKTTLSSPQLTGLNVRWFGWELEKFDSDSAQDLYIYKSLTVESYQDSYFPSDIQVPDIISVDGEGYLTSIEANNVVGRSFCIQIWVDERLLFECINNRDNNGAARLGIYLKGSGGLFLATNDGVLNSLDFVPLDGNAGTSIPINSQPWEKLPAFIKNDGAMGRVYLIDKPIRFKESFRIKSWCGTTVGQDTHILRVRGGLL